jgi:hypothetical protein
VNDWLHNLPMFRMALVVFGLTYLIAAAIHVGVIALAVGERGRSFKAVSPGMLPPLGIIFGLFVAFTAAQVWNDTERATTAVNREASALRSIAVIAANFPEETSAKLRSLMRSYIAEVATTEWPMMAGRSATLTDLPDPLVRALQLTIALTPTTQGQQAAQRELITAIETVFDARRQRIITSQSGVNPVKWLCLFLQAACALLAIALVHSDNRLASAITVGLFATGVAASVLLIAAHDRPFTGEISVRPDPLLQIMPQVEATPPKTGG